MNRKTIVVSEARGPDATIRKVRTSYIEAGAGEPVVLLHGGCVGGSAAGWSATIQGLADRYRVIAPDLLWSGHTDKPPVSVSLVLQGAHLAGFIDALKLDSVRIVGQSIGAYLAARYACDYIDRVSHLAMIGSNTVALAMGVSFQPNPPGGSWPEDERERQFAQMQWMFHRPELITEDRLAARTEIGSLPGVAEARKSFAIHTANLLARSPNVFQAFDLRNRLPVIELPSVLIWGKEDRFAPVTIGRDLTPLLPRTLYVEVDQGGHAVYLDQPQTVNELLGRFFIGALSLDDLPYGAHSGESSSTANESGSR